MKILFSWIAWNNDFTGNRVDMVNSPNYLFHQHFFDGFDKHIILSQEEEDGTRLSILLNRICIDFPMHATEGYYMGIKDVIDVVEIKPKVEAKLLEYSNDEIGIFFSPGTSGMQLAWYLCHTTLNLNTRIFQTRPASKSKSGKPEIIELKIETSTSPITAIIKEKGIDSKEKYEYLENYKLTRSIQPVYNRAYKIAQTNKVTSLILGESGTGKEHLARFIHKNSNRKEQPFIAINCSAFQDSLLESRLFGYEKGAFTDAKESTKGIFEQAQDGTVFLDEIGDISPYMQQTLLRVLQEKEVTPIGGKTRKINVRIIAATNKNLPQLCKEDRFRWDLYYRLSVAELELPSLRKRGKEETEEMFEFFLKAKKKEMKKGKLLKLNKEAKANLLNYPFPGNIRELENMVETLYVFCDEEVNVSDLPERVFNVPEDISFKWEDVEKAHIQRVLNYYKGNQRQTCMALGYGSINTLKKKMTEYDINFR